MSKCVVACSGGPDSMALLDQLNKQGKDIVVAHVNYKHRDTADRDEKIVKEYCKNMIFLFEFYIRCMRKEIFRHGQEMFVMPFLKKWQMNLIRNYYM